MGSKNVFIAFVLCLACVSLCAREVTDTLESSKRDKVIVTYNVTQNDGQVVVEFLHARKILGKTYRDKYKSLDEVAILFFDRIGNYEDGMRFSGINVSAFMVPSDVVYESSEDGYFLLNDNPKLKFKLRNSETIELAIPLFLAHYERKLRYKVFSRCEDLIIKLSNRKPSKRQVVPTQQLITQTVTSQEEVEEPLSESDEAKIHIRIIYDLLDEQDGEEFSSELQQAISRLRVIGHSTSDQNLSSRINSVLDECKVREKELKASANAVAESAAKEAELRAKHAEEQAQARHDSIAAAAQQKAEEDRKQNLWLIIGGVILAVLAFVGNQMFQHFRNVKNQKSIMDMQQNVVKRAEDEAKRRARNMAQSQINRVQGEARRKTRSAINDGIGKMGKKGKGNKGISI